MSAQALADLQARAIVRHAIAQAMVNGAVFTLLPMWRPMGWRPGMPTATAPAV